MNPLARGQAARFSREGTRRGKCSGSGRDGREAVESIDEHQPDLVFLDVQMPEFDGFQVLDNLDGDLPTVVFTTAYDQYALKAFEVHAIDYLLKPYDRERFTQAMERARSEVERRQVGDMRQQVMALLQDVSKKRATFPERLVIKSSGKVVFVKASDIDWVDAAGNYVKIHCGSETHLLRETMGRLEKRLDPQKFLRIHRSTIVNIDRIRELQQQFHGDYLVVLDNGQRLTLSRSYREKIKNLLDRSL